MVWTEPGLWCAMVNRCLTILAHSPGIYPPPWHLSSVSRSACTYACASDSVVIFTSKRSYWIVPAALCAVCLFLVSPLFHTSTPSNLIQALCFFFFVSLIFISYCKLHSHVTWKKLSLIIKHAMWILYKKKSFILSSAVYLQCLNFSGWKGDLPAAKKFIEEEKRKYKEYVSTKPTPPCDKYIARKYYCFISRTH